MDQPRRRVCTAGKLRAHLLLVDDLEFTGSDGVARSLVPAPADSSTLADDIRERTTGMVNLIGGKLRLAREFARLATHRAMSGRRPRIGYLGASDGRAGNLGDDVMFHAVQA